jgi:hypothetical protein
MARSQSLGLRPYNFVLGLGAFHTFKYRQDHLTPTQRLKWYFCLLLSVAQQHLKFHFLLGPNMVLQFEGMSEAQVDEHAKRAAEYFWWTCRQDVESIILTREDLELLVSNEQDVDFLFRLFDCNDDGFVLVEEVVQRFTQMYRCVIMRLLHLTIASRVAGQAQPQFLAAARFGCCTFWLLHKQSEPSAMPCLEKIHTEDKS